MFKESTVLDQRPTWLVVDAIRIKHIIQDQLREVRGVSSVHQPFLSPPSLNLPICGLLTGLVPDEGLNDMYCWYMVKCASNTGHCLNAVCMPDGAIEIERRFVTWCWYR